MATNKNALIRYMILDRLLSDPTHRYTCRDLVIKCNDELEAMRYKTILCGGMSESSIRNAKRIILLDLEALQAPPFNLEIDSSDKIFNAPVYRYSDPTRTLFSKKLSNDEKMLLKEILSTLGTFSGIDSFEWLDSLSRKLEDRRSFGDSNPYVQKNGELMNPIMSFDENKYLRNRDCLPTLYAHIAHKQPVVLGYRKYLESEIKKFNVHPYLLKQYANRWYLICSLVADDSGKFNPNLILNLALDRLEGDIVPDMNHKYVECPVDLSERYEEIIGVTYNVDEPLETIVFAIDEKVAPFIETKPLHESQTRCNAPELQMEGYKTFKIECRFNYELLSVLSGFGDSVIILSPERIRRKMTERIERMMNNYGLNA